MLSHDTSGVMSAYCITKIRSRALQPQSTAYGPSPEVFPGVVCGQGSGKGSFVFYGGLSVGR